MSAGLIAVTGLIYFGIFLEQAFKYQNVNMSLVYFGYALANVGLYYMASVKNV